jgi:mannose-1-phosphate guanylyltransferase / mannose-6-phosphate isomerase
MYSIILCGGSGTRLWPLSRKNFPKQFLKLYSDKSLLQETFLRMREIMPGENIYFVTNQDNLFNVFNQIKEIEDNFDIKQILTEPMSLNTAPAISYAVKYLAEKRDVDLSSPIIILPADHFIGDKKTYLDLVVNSMNTVGDKIGTIGIKPQGPETGFGYIKKGENTGEYFQVSEFKEKPNKVTAIEYVNSGEYVWNSGMYIFNIKTFAREVREHAPEIYRLLEQSFEVFLDKFSEMPSISVDYAISEKSTNVVVWEGDFGWSDIGSFDSLAEKMGKKENKQHINIDSKNIYVHSPNNKLIVTLGVEDLVVIENSDSILVHKKGRGEDVKKVVNYLKENRTKELEHNLIVHRPWGKYEVLVDNPEHKVKKITVYPEAKLSLQAHYHRAEHWVVVKGTAKVVNGDKDIILRENESTFIPAYSNHRLENPGKINLEMIEVQTGNYLEEDDIIRFDDIYNREGNK